MIVLFSVFLQKFLLSDNLCLCLASDKNLVLSHGDLKCSFLAHITFL